MESSFLCPNGSCQRIISSSSLQRQLIMMIRKHMSCYLDQSVVCDDPTCQTKTRFSGVFGRKCLMPKCRGLLSLQFSDRALYTQLQYFEWLFNFERILKKHPNATGMLLLFFTLCSYLLLLYLYLLLDAIQTCLEKYNSHIATLGKTVDQYLDTSLRRWVDMKQIFAFA